MNLLVVSTWYPFPADNGSRLRAFHLLQQLAKRHRIWLVTGLQDDCSGDHAAILRGEHPPELTSLCESIQAVPWVWHQPGGSPLGAARAFVDPVPRSVRETPNPAFVAAVNAGLARKPDVILGLELGVDAYLPIDPGVPMVLEQVEVSGGENAFRSQQGVARLLMRLAYEKGVRYRRSRLTRYAALTAVSEEEAEAVRRTARGVPVAVIPNGVDTRRYTPRDPARAVPGRLIYNGGLGYKPNADAVRWFVRDILPEVVRRVPEAHLVVTGRKDIPAAREFEGVAGVHLTGLLLDLREALSDATIAVAPLREGGGTRLKILEAWAAGLPVVSTLVGAMGLGAVDGTHLMLADAAAQFATRVVNLLQNPTEQARLAENARRYVESRYDWSAIGAELAALLESLSSTV